MLSKYRLIIMGLPEDLTFFFLSNPVYLLLLGLISGIVMAYYSNRDNILSNRQFFITIILFFYTVTIILIGVLVFLAVVIFPNVQQVLVNMFTAIGLVLSFLAVGMTIGYSVDNSLSTIRLQTHFDNAIQDGFTNQRTTFQETINSSFQELNTQIQNQNHHFEEILKNNNHQLQTIIQTQNHHIEEILENNNQQLQLHLQNHYFAEVITNNNRQLEIFIQKQNHRIEEMIENNNHQLQAHMKIHHNHQQTSQQSE